MELEYVKCGDYYIPALRANEEPEEPLTKWGLMRRSFLKGTSSGDILWDDAGGYAQRSLSDHTTPG